MLATNSFRSIQEQVRLLGESLDATELEAYVRGDGPTSEWVPDNGAKTNLLRTKDWHMGRVKFFFERFVGRQPVDPIRVDHHPTLGWVAHDGAHRVLGAHFAGVGGIEAIFPETMTGAL